MSIKRLDHVNFITYDMSATIVFYTETIGLIRGPNLASAASGMEYFYIPGENIAILHVGNANIERHSTRFIQLAKLPENKNDFATGILDHFCLSLELFDYEVMIAKLDSHEIIYKTYCQPEGKLKQIWILDPNGIRVELNFTN